ncbi:MAG: phytanoyl-CoA dioxygenase family protein [Chloroflexi bacterium]|nr:phytanoyl-CoA dioxygenase family protein [Chloroflexota bacterium]OJV90240.1 MAG: phytanoyl-CoA dioxygenase [Chloroflexi bacterium 54-19]
MIHPPHPQAVPTQLKDIKKKLPLRVLSEADWKHWTTYGYVIVPNAVPQDQLKRLVDLLWEFSEMDPNDPETWYQTEWRDHSKKLPHTNGMLEIYNHQYLWDKRQTPRVYDAFVDIWDREDLWVSIDRVNMNPPSKGIHSSNGFIHWDADTSLNPLPIEVQGVLSLARQDEEVGGFQCVPELFRTLEEWIKTQPADRNPGVPDTTGFEVVTVNLNPGDLLIFNSLLPHGIRPNRSKNRMRMAQYIAMNPAKETDEAELAFRLNAWRNFQIPQHGDFPGDPREWEKKNAQVAKLTPLGERLLGLKSWK